ncbi:MAG: Deoxycytidine triphosphate deaminase [Candidatus Bipolaricaulis sibiricus]|uniref:Deoxycytidine triphosphate deaminase n=1 Tax=Bipolaricaulis sibiricus TaxID=2501609 RepID=A0A410FVT4_BIPS1|nr:MAG: Deoxycytidine triphosphate deaminase [Candidatus Bipolaricaulis sibiricus]
MKGQPLSDREITMLCAGPRPMLSPFVPHQEGKPSYGLSSFGYDLRLGTRFLVPLGGVNAVLDPVNFPRDHFREVVAETTFDLAPHSQVLAESVEAFEMPDDVMGLAFGKSSYARCGLLCNLTPVEPSWRGRLTLELANLSPLPIRLHVGQGIAQVVFFRGERPARTYEEKEAGRAYQGQEGVTLPR